MASRYGQDGYTDGPPTGRHALPSDAHWQYVQLHQSQNWKSEAASHYQPHGEAMASRRELDKMAMTAMLQKAGIGWVHRAAPRPEPVPSEFRHSKRIGNQSSYTVSSFEAPPRTPRTGYPEPHPSASGLATSKLHKMLGL